MQLPDLNAETHPFGIVEELLDRSAYFDLVTACVENRSRGLRHGGDVVGFELVDAAYPFGSAPEGTPLANLTQRWLFMPDDYAARPGQLPPATPFRPERPQRFAMVGTECRFASERDGFQAFGTGCTFPTGDGRLWAAAVGVLHRGFGKLAQGDGTFTYNGELRPDSGFRGRLTLRVLNPVESLLSNDLGAGPPYTGSPDTGSPDTGTGTHPGIHHLHFHGRKHSKQSRTEFLFHPDGTPRGFQLEQELTQLRLRCAVDGERGLRTQVEVGRVVGRMTSKVFLNILDPGAPGTLVRPIPFDSRNEFFLRTPDGRQLGSFETRGGEGRSFVLRLRGLPEQQALRFGAFQPITTTSGCFDGLQGILTDNSAVGVAPHATSTFYAVRLSASPGRQLLDLVRS